MPIADALKLVKWGPRPSDSALSLLNAMLHSVGAEAARLHKIDLSSAKLSRVVEVGAIPHSASTDTELLNSLLSSHPSKIMHGQLYRLMLPIKRKSVSIGVVDIYSYNENLFSSTSGHRLECLSNLFDPIFESLYTESLLMALQHPIDFRRPETDFFSDIALLIGEASGMQFAALREWDGSQLRCLAQWGFSNDVSTEDLDLVNLERLPSFTEALSGKTAVVTDPDCDELRLLRAKAQLKDVKSFVVTPIVVGSEVFGVLSASTSCVYDYSPIEIKGLETIANGVGVSIANFRNFYLAHTDVARLSQVAISVSAIEVAQSVRHEAKLTIDNCQAKIALIIGKPGKRVSDVSDELDSLSDGLQSVYGALERIKAATKPPARLWEMASLQEVWSQAVGQLSGRLADLRIAHVYDGPDVQIEICVDWFRQVFLNLLLNSVDAFRSRSKGGGKRKISLQVSTPHDRTKNVEMTYTDNGGGIDQSKLNVPEGMVGTPVDQVIFEKNVTSKVDGSGWGLFLVRKVLADHHGSVNLIDYRGGVTFRIDVPKKREL